MARRKQLLTTADAKPAKQQHRSPCSDCPFARTALRGWLGGDTPDEYSQLAHSEAVIGCHTRTGAQCAGSAIYRANILKLCRDPEILRLPQDKERVFATPMEFLTHHRR